MKPIRLTTLGILAAGMVIGAVSALAAPTPTPAGGQQFAYYAPLILSALPL